MLCHHTGDKRMVRRCMWRSLPNYFVMTHDIISLECETQHSNVTLAKITWHHAQNVVSLRVLYKFNSTFVICLKFVFIEKLDKLITYIVYMVKNIRQNEQLPFTSNYWTQKDHDICQWKSWSLFWTDTKMWQC